jgi:AcrR family transcriptional regulator
MPRLGPARTAARRRQIIDGALTCFARHGFRDTTMRQIVRQCGLSPGAIYCHFSGKHEIILAAIKERHRREYFLTELAAAQPDLGLALDRLAVDFLHPLAKASEREWRKLTIALWAESLNDASLRSAAREGVDAPRRSLAEMVRRAQGRGELPAGLDPDVTARLFIAMFQGLVLQQAWDNSLDIEPCIVAIKAILDRAKPEIAN